MDLFFVVKCHWLDVSHTTKFDVRLIVYLTIIPGECVGYERDHRVDLSIVPAEDL